MIDRKLIISSFLTLRFTEMTDVDFTNKLKYRRPEIPFDEGRILIRSAKDIDEVRQLQIAEKVKNHKKIGIFL